MEREKFLEESKQSCPFCVIETKRPEDVAFETENFVALVDIAPPTPYYFVLFPKSHALSFAELEDEYAPEFQEAVERISDVTNNRSWLFFENGAGNRNGKGYGIVSHQSVYHAHLNMVGVREGEEGVWDRIFDAFMEYDGIQIYQGIADHIVYPSSLLKRITGGRPYFFQRMNRVFRIVFEEGDEKIIPSQFVRRTVAKYFNREKDHPFWDWKNIDPLYLRDIEERKETLRRLFS